MFRKCSIPGPTLGIQQGGGPSVGFDVRKLGFMLRLYHIPAAEIQVSHRTVVSCFFGHLRMKIKLLHQTEIMHMKIFGKTFLKQENDATWLDVGAERTTDFTKSNSPESATFYLLILQTIHPGSRWGKQCFAAHTPYMLAASGTASPHSGTSAQGSPSLRYLVFMEEGTS